MGTVLIHRRHSCSLALWLVPVAAGLAGCAAVPGTIPTGRWVGQGRFVDYEARFGEDLNTVTRTRGNDGRYETELSIARRNLFAHDALVFDVVSRRGELMNIEGDETRLRFALVEIETLRNGSGLYAVTEVSLDPEPDATWDEDGFREQLQFAGATRTQTEAGTVLQIYYAMAVEEGMIWTDTFVFRDGRVLKIGRLAQPPQEDSENARLYTVYWTEELRRVP